MPYLTHCFKLLKSIQNVLENKFMMIPRDAKHGDAAHG